jgi:O-antigen ligase/tetratricopeptide (TPR) repeat protein
MVLAAALLFVVLIGGTDAGRFLTVVRGATALVGAGMILNWILRVRDSDLVDRLVLAALLFFLLACVLSTNPRESFEASTSALAFAAAAFVARGALATQRSQDLAVTILALCGIVLSAAFVFVWGTAWLWWFDASGGMLPPLDLILPVGPYRHYHVVGTTMALLMPALFVLARRPRVWPLAIIGIVCSATVVLMSGSRTVWLAIGGGLVATVAVLIAQRRVRISPAWWLLGAGAVSLAVLVLLLGGPLGSRLLGTSTVALRGALWEATLSRWLLDPLTGAGPGSFSTEITLSGFFASYDGIGRHADNAVVQVMAEAGVLGLAALGLLAAATVIGVRRSKLRLAPTAALVIFCVASLTDNPSDSAHLVVIGIVWFAVATPRNPITTVRVRPNPWMRVGFVASLGVIAVACAALLLASLAYDRAAARRAGGDEPGALEELSLAARLDPSYSLYHRELGLALLAKGALADASTHVGRAIQLNPGDLTALRIGSYLAVQVRDLPSAMTLADRAVELGGVRPTNSTLQAYVADAAGEADVSRQAVIRALRFAPWIAASPAWSEHFPSAGALAGLLREARLAWLVPDVPPERYVLQRAWLDGLNGVADEVAQTRLRTINALIRCDLVEAKRLVSGMSTIDRSTIGGLLARLLEARISGDQDPSDLLVLILLRAPEYAYLATTELSARSPLADRGEDARLYRRLTMPPPDVGPLLPDADAGLSAWLRNPVAAADVGAPGSGLAACR